MDLAGYVVNAVLVENRSVAEVAEPTAYPGRGSTSSWPATGRAERRG
jgi:hypothetical protein